MAVNKPRKKSAPKVEATPAPTSLEDALKVIETMRSTIDAGIEKIEALGAEIASKDSRIYELEGEVADREDSIDALEEENRELQEKVTLDGEAINELACIEQKMKRGRPDREIREDIDRLLQKIDCGGAIRLSAVPVML